MKYSDQLKSTKWQKKRLEILNRDNWKCQKCGDSETELHVHHLKYSGKPYDSHNDDLITLCKHCHLLITEADTIHINDIEVLIKEIVTDYYINLCFKYNNQVTITGLYSIRYDESSGVHTTNCIGLANNSKFYIDFVKLLQNG